MARKWYEKAYTGTGKGLQNLYGGIFGKGGQTYGAEYPVGEAFGRIMPLIGQVEGEAGGIRERLFPEYQAALARAKTEVPSEEGLFGVAERRLRESLLPQLAASGLATSKGIDVLSPRVGELAQTFGERSFERELARQQNIRQALEGLKTLEILPTEIREKLIALILGQQGIVPQEGAAKTGLWTTLFGGGQTGSSASGAISAGKTLIG